MRVGKKKVIKIILCILLLFVMINACWYVWRMVKYDPFTKGMEKSEIPEFLVPRYYSMDADGYDYSVKYPDYLSFTGNLCVGLPTTDENVFTDFLIIWPKLFDRYEYGVSLNAEGETYQIYINSDGSPVDPRYSEIVNEYKDTIDDLLSRAKEMWDIDRS